MEGLAYFSKCRKIRYHVCSMSEWCRVENTNTDDVFSMWVKKITHTHTHNDNNSELTRSPKSKCQKPKRVETRWPSPRRRGPSEDPGMSYLSHGLLILISHSVCLMKWLGGWVKNAMQWGVKQLNQENWHFLDILSIRPTVFIPFSINLTFI